MSRLPMFAAVLVLETTSISIFLLALGLQPVSWFMLLLLLLAGAVTEWQIERLPEGQQRFWLGGVALACAVSAVALHVGGLSNAVAALFPGSGSPLFAAAYGALLVAFFAFWCGTRSTSHTAGSIAQAFSFGVFGAIIGLLIAPLVDGLGDPVRVRLLTMQILVLVGSGLLAQALVRADEETEGEQRRWSWRWLATFGLAIGAVALLGLAVSSMFVGPAAALLELLWRGVVLLLFIVMLPILFLLGWLVDALIHTFGMPKSSRPPITIPQLPSFSDNTQSLLPGASAWALTGVAVLTALLPLVLLVLLILFARRRRKGIGANEERESLLTWSTVATDLRGLFKGFRRPFARQLAGLHAALLALRGNDPASRVRRSYVRLLLALEGRDNPRPPASTPAEYAPTAREGFSTAAPAVAVLTEAYERARYGPAVGDDDAVAAERAWNDLEREQRT